MAQISRSGDLTSGPMLQKIILFSLPLAASSILQLLFNAADVVTVGRFAGSTALAAVGSNGALINLLVNLFVGLSLLWRAGRSGRAEYCPHGGDAGPCQRCAAGGRGLFCGPGPVGADVQPGGCH